MPDETNNVINLMDLGGPEISDALVEWLEEKLEQAKTGKLQGMAGAFREDDGNSFYFALGYVGGFSVLGALAVTTNLLANSNQ